MINQGIRIRKGSLRTLTIVETVYGNGWNSDNMGPDLGRVPIVCLRIWLTPMLVYSIKLVIVDHVAVRAILNSLEDLMDEFNCFGFLKVHIEFFGIYLFPIVDKIVSIFFLSLSCLKNLRRLLVC